MPLAEKDTTIVALASNVLLDSERPVFDLNDTTAISDFVVKQVGLW